VVVRGCLTSLHVLSPLAQHCRQSAVSACCVCLFFSATATTEIYTLSLHDALPISDAGGLQAVHDGLVGLQHALLVLGHGDDDHLDRKSTRLNSSHVSISYAVFCLKKKKKSQK